MIILVSLLRRLPELSREEFVEHHRETHAPLFVSMETVRRVVRRYTVDHPQSFGVPGVADTTFDAVVRQWFDDTSGIQELMTSKDYLETIRPDEARFIDMSRSEFYLAEDQVFLGEPTPRP
ncbi:EthD domain-containing protein [Amycolatopsis sp. CA-230715]|uniref:EthD domain-containing protein n=1 Tax=Amycolatopsis sp. CA-230715 TaxID=2745196 RepID=UPI001C027EF8|nr:EthD domain-containing protein [Amycolatopsis sp. CA-230715]